MRDKSIPEFGHTANRYNSRFSAPTYRGFCLFEPTTATEAHRSNLITSGATDQWTSWQLVSTNAEQPAVTSRAFGLARTASRNHGTGQIQTGDEVFDDQAEGSRVWPRLETQRVHLGDLFITHTDGAEQVDLFQIHP